MDCVGLIGCGAMGSALAAGWREAGVRVVTALVGRSDRTGALVRASGIEVLPGWDDVATVSDVVVSVVPPGVAVSAARDFATAAVRTDSRFLYVDLNAVAPSTVLDVERVLAGSGCEVVDGSISGGPPGADGPPVRVYLSGPRAAEFAALPSGRLDIVLLDGGVGRASALKMCTASMYKGTKALVMQALLTADVYGVRDEFLADTSREWPDDVPGWHLDIAIAASKAWRFVDEMHEIARTQRDAGLPDELFEGVAAAYVRAAATELGGTPTEDVDRTASVDEVLARLHMVTGTASG